MRIVRPACLALRAGTPRWISGATGPGCVLWAACSAWRGRAEQRLAHSGLLDGGHRLGDLVHAQRLLLRRRRHLHIRLRPASTSAAIWWIIMPVSVTSRTPVSTRRLRSSVTSPPLWSNLDLAEDLAHLLGRIFGLVDPGAHQPRQRRDIAILIARAGGLITRSSARWLIWSASSLTEVMIVLIERV